jgi:TrmH family RNA methyltransferase
MKLITSGDNQICKSTAQLKQKKYRDELKKYLIEGPNLIHEALANGGEIELVIKSEDFEFEEIGVPAAVMTAGLFRKLSDTENPQGIMAIVKKRIYTEKDFFTPVVSEPVKDGDSAAKAREPSNIVVLDRLQDPGNIGTILRTADAAGYRGAILMKGTGDIYSPKIVRAAAGSLFRLPVLMADTPEQAVGLLKKYGKTIIGTTPSCDRYYYDIDMRTDTALVIGNEGNGACAEFLEQADLKIKIPMEGTIESLNAAVSAGILMYESVRQRYSAAD